MRAFCWLVGLVVVCAFGQVAAGDDGLPVRKHRFPTDTAKTILPKTVIARRFGLVGRPSEYSLPELDKDRHDARAYAAMLVRQRRIKPADEAKAAADRAADLRTRFYPRTWSRHEKLKLYRREVAELERFRGERIAEANAQHDTKRRRDSKLDEMAERFKAIQEEEAQHAGLAGPEERGGGAGD